MNMEKETAKEFFSEFYGGEHHFPSEMKSCGNGWAITDSSGDIATFDFNAMTRLVFMAHDKCIRVSLCPSGIGRIQIRIYQRQREGGYSERHPTIETALAQWREKYPAGAIQ